MRVWLLVFGAVLAVACGGGGGNGNQTGNDAGSDAGTCTNTCPSAGATQCSGPLVQTCASVNGCLSWSTAAKCSGDQYCNPTQNACVACGSNCAFEGQTKCVDASSFERCGTDQNGCHFLSATATACPSDQLCDPGQQACVTKALASCGTPTPMAGTVSGPSMDPGTCQLPEQASSLPGQVQSLGKMTVRSDVKQFTIPPNTGSFTILLQAPDAGPPATTVSGTFQGQRFTTENSAFPSMIAQPDGGVVLDALTPDEGRDAGIWQPDPPATTSAITAPNTSLSLAAWADGGVPAGQWSLAIEDFSDFYCLPDAGFGVTCTNNSFTDQYDVSVLTRGPTPLPGSLDVAIYLVSESATSLPFLQTAALAANAPEVKRMISSLQNIYSRAGICIANVTIHDVPAWAKAKYSSIDSSRTSPCDPIDQLFTLSEPNVNELNIFLVDDITQTSSGSDHIVGIDGAIPGPSSFGGTVHSGAVVNATDLTYQFAADSCNGALDVIDCGADLVAYIAAHEGGHWMGLFHTTEALGNSFDPLADTGSCPCTSCVTGTRRNNCVELNPTTSTPTTMRGADCNKGPPCDGSQSVMFWLIDPTAVGNVSSEQGQVMRLNPVVK